MQAKKKMNTSGKQKIEHCKSREFEIIILGATSIAGKSVVDYFTSHVPHRSICSSGTNWAIAGQDRSKLLKLKNSIKNSIHPSCEVEIITTDTTPQSIVQVTGRAEVIINCLGPYRFYGKIVVSACIQTRTDYLDLAYEAPYIQDLILNFDNAAIDNEVHILPGCGANEVLSDVGIFYAKTELEPGQISSGECFIQSDNQSFKDVAQGDWMYSVDRSCDLTNSLQPRRKGVEALKINTRHDKRINKWATPLNNIAASLIVYRTSELLVTRNTYFQYGHYLAVSSFFQMLYLFFSLWILTLFCKFDFTKKFLGNLKEQRPSIFEDSPTQPNTDENLEEENEWNLQSEEFSQKKGVKLIVVARGEVSPYIATSSNQRTLRQVVIKVSAPNHLSQLQISALTASQCAICLLNYKNRSPLKGGVVTPVSTFGNFLIGKLQNANIVFKVRHCEILSDDENEYSEENYRKPILSTWGNLITFFQVIFKKSTEFDNTAWW